ncbi:hypothetical protein Btru_071865, partial [Bulinus truncatus]
MKRQASTASRLHRTTVNEAMGPLSMRPWGHCQRGHGTTVDKAMGPLSMRPWGHRAASASLTCYTLQENRPGFMEIRFETGEILLEKDDHRVILCKSTRNCSVLHVIREIDIKTVSNRTQNHHHVAIEFANVSRKTFIKLEGLWKLKRVDKDLGEILVDQCTVSVFSKPSVIRCSYESRSNSSVYATCTSDMIYPPAMCEFCLLDDEVLEKFIQTAEAFSDGIPCPDIVGSFCISSPNLAEFFNLIEPSSCKLKINDVALVFECLEQILARIRNDLVKLSSVGEAIVQKVLAVHMGQLYYSLRDQNKLVRFNIQIIVTLAVFTLAGSTRCKKLCGSFTLAFLLDSDNTVINFLVQQKTFLQSVIGGLMYDPKEVVIDTLATLMDKAQVVGELGRKKSDQDEEVNIYMIESDQDEEVDVPDDDRQVVADVAHNFLTELCCSHKHGINFHDKTLGIGNRNQNQLLTHFLEWLVKTIDDAQTSDLIISILCTCPDQIKIVLNNLCAFLSPRWSEKWIKLMDWLAKLYISLPEDLQFLAEKDTANEANKIVSMAVVLCLPPPKVCVTLQQGIKHEDPRVRHTALKVISVLLFKAINVKKKLMLRLSGEQKNSLAEIVSDSYTASVLMMLPPLSQIFFCADKIMQKVEDEESSDFQEKAAVILQVLTLYQHLSPSLISDKQKDLSNLIEMVGQVVVTDTSKTECDEDKTAIDNVNSRVEQPLLPQLYLLGLLSEIDAKTLYLGRESILLKLLSFASHCGQYRSLCVGLIGKMLQSVEVFSGHGKELSVWVETALKNTFNADLEMAVSGSSIIRFMANCLGVLINNPAPYVDRLLEAATESSLSDDQTLESKINEKNTLEDILAMDQKELDDKLTVFQPSSFHIQKNELPLSPLIFVALDNLNSNTGVDDCVKSYVNNVLAQLVYTVTSPQTLASIVCSHKVAIDEPVREYIRYWHCNEFQVKPTKIKPLPAELYGRCTNLLMRVFFSHSKTATDVSDAFGQLTKEIRSLDTFAKLKTLRLVLFFMSQTAERHSKEQFCHQVLEVLQEVAEVLIDEVADDENWISRDKQTELTDEQLSKSEMKEKKEHSASSVFSQVAEPLQNTFSDVLVSLNQSVDTSKEDFLHLLRNPTFKKFVFQKKGKSNKANEKFDILACSLSRFMNKVLNKCKTWTWFLCEKEIIQQLVSDLVTSLIVPAKPKHSELDSIHLDMLINVYPILDLVTLSKSVTQLLTLPLSSFFNKDKDESTDTNETHTFKVLCLMLQHWVHLIKADPSFICASLFQQLTSDVQIKKVPIQMEESNKNHSNAIRISYSVEESTLQSPAAFASMFELLPLCRDSNFHDVVLFVKVSHLPEVGHGITSELAIFNELLQMQLNVKNKKTVKEQIVACLIESVSECFPKFCTWIQWPMQVLSLNRRNGTLLIHILQLLINSYSLFEVLVVSTKFSHQSEEEESRKASSDLAELALRHLLYLTSSKTTRHSEMENYILDLLLTAGELVHLLYLLGELEPSVYAPSSIKGFDWLYSYNATLSETDFQEKAAVILQVLTLYQHLSPSLISDKQKDLSNLIEMVGQVVVIDTSKTECDEDKTAIDDVNSRVEQPLLPQLYLLGLLSEIDAKTLYLGRESILLKLLSFASHCGQYRSLCVGLIGKMLQSVEVFSGHGKELSVWVETALKNTFNADLEMAVSGSSIIRFMANCLGVLINNPAPYVDRLLEAATESSLSDDQALESKINEKNTLEDILAMDQKELDDKLTAFQPSSFHIQKNELPLSPLIFVALDNLNSNTGVDDCVKSYVNNVLALLVYTVASPQTLATIVCSHKVAIDEPVREYIRYWHCNE